MFGRLPTRLAAFVCLLGFVAFAGGAVTAGVATTDSVATADISTPEPNTDTDLATADVDTDLATADMDTDFAVDSRFASQEAVETDRVRIDIALAADGSARWQIEFWSVLDDDDSVQAFESLRDDIAADPDNYTTEFATGIDETVETASQSTGREMTATEFSVETDRQSLSREYGIVTYRFEWAGFAQADGDTIQAGDAIDGLFLDDDSRLLISWPADYDRQSVTPDPDDERANAVLWRGSTTEFLTGEPRLTVAQPLLGVGSGTLAVSLAVAAIIFAVAGWLLRRRSATDVTDDCLDSSEPASTAANGPSTPTETDDSVEPSSAADASSPAAAAPSSAAQSATASTEPDPELLSNEEQVLRLIEANGGRMKQQTVVQELGWTDAKTSKVVSTLREDEKLESFRIGRENVLRVPDDDEEGSSL